MLGTGVIVAITSVVLVGVGGLFGTDWERRQIDRYVRQHRGRNRAEAAAAAGTGSPR
jgi:hypothetical protein